MTRIVGIDLSLTGTGLAVVANEEWVPVEYRNWSLITNRVTSKGATKDQLQQRFDRQTVIAQGILAQCYGSDLVVIEDLFTGPKAGHVIDRAGLWWRVVGVLLHQGIKVVHCTATQAKKFQTGNGAADKGAMVRAAGKMWPEWEPSSNASTEDEADAIALVNVGLALTHDEWPFPATDYRLKVLNDIRKQQQLEEVPA